MRIKQYVVNEARKAEVIIVKSICGEGTENDVCREVIEYWSLDGKLLARVDDYAKH